MSEVRKFQIFEANLPQGQSLELLPSPWLVDGLVSIPLEHWELLRELAVANKVVGNDLWVRMSTLDGERPEPIEIKMFVTGLKVMMSRLRTDMTAMLRLTQGFPEPLPGSEHARMLEAVVRVLEKSGSQADSWVE